jgi:hypothetical protein
VANRKPLPHEYDLIEDLGLHREQEEYEFPPEEPGVPTLYDDVEVTEYSDRPMRTRVVPISRDNYSKEAAYERFKGLQEKHGWRVVGRPFTTARHFCWRIAVDSDA